MKQYKLYKKEAKNLAKMLGLQIIQIEDNKIIDSLQFCTNKWSSLYYFLKGYAMCKLSLTGSIKKVGV